MAVGDIQKYCSSCEGTGEITVYGSDPENPEQGVAQPCPLCDSNGHFYWAKIEDLDDELNVIKDKLDDILELLQ